MSVMQACDGQTQVAVATCNETSSIDLPACCDVALTNNNKSLVLITNANAVDFAKSETPALSQTCTVDTQVQDILCTPTSDICITAKSPPVIISDDNNKLLDDVTELDNVVVENNVNNLMPSNAETITPHIVPCCLHTADCLWQKDDDLEETDDEEDEDEEDEEEDDEEPKACETSEVEYSLPFPVLTQSGGQPESFIITEPHLHSTESLTVGVPELGVKGNVGGVLADVAVIKKSSYPTQHSKGFTPCAPGKVHSTAAGNSSNRTSSSFGAADHNKSSLHRSRSACDCEDVVNKQMMLHNPKHNFEHTCHPTMINKNACKILGEEVLLYCTECGPVLEGFACNENEKLDRKKKKSIGTDVRERFAALARRPNTDPTLSNTTASSSKAVQMKEGERVWRSWRPTTAQIQKWSESFDALLSDKCGLGLFQAFLRTEFSDENIDFWIACEEYKSINGVRKMTLRSQKIYNDFITVQAPREVNLDHGTRDDISRQINSPDKHLFDQAQKKIQGLMEKDSFQRFLRWDVYQSMVKECSDST